MGRKHGSLGCGRLVVAGVAVCALTGVLAAPTGATSSAQPGRTYPPRPQLGVAAGLGASGLGASGLGSLNSANSPYRIGIYTCGDQSASSFYYYRSFVTLYAYGGDGGANSSGTPGGAGSLAAGSFDLPYLNPGTWIVQGRPGCKGAAAQPGATAGGVGGAALGSDGAWPGLGGHGGAGAAAGDGGGGGGTAGIWLVSIFPGPYGHALYASGGGGAGGGSGGGAGGDGDHAGQAASTGGAAPGQPGSVLAGGPDYLTHAGAGGVPSANGQMYTGGPGASGSGAHGVGGGGGGAGWGGGGGGASGERPVGVGAGGAGGGSVARLTNAGYWASAGGVGHSTGSDGLLERVEVRDVARHATFPGRDVVRGLAPNGNRGGGYEVLGSGDIRTFSQGVNPAAAKDGPHWPGQDVARGIATLPDRSGGYVVDLHGQLHPFTIGDHAPPPAVTNRVLWPGKDIARGVAILPDGTGGYVLGRDGRMYAFAIGKHPKPRDAQRVPIWKNQDVTRGVTAPFVDQNGVAGGWITDVFGRLHPWGRLFGAPTPEAVGPNVAARGVVSFVGGAGGLLVDGAGNLSNFASPGYP